MVSLRTATEADVPRLVDLGRLMHLESRFAQFDFNASKWATTVRNLIPQGLVFVAEDEDLTIGMFVGVVATHFFGNDSASYDLVTYVLPGHRGRAGVMLTKEYVRRAKGLGVRDINIGVSTNISPERTGRLYAKLGFRCVGGMFTMEG